MDSVKITAGKRHCHYDMIVAKAANMDLVVFCQNENKTWLEVNFDDLIYSQDKNAFICLPQHKEAVLHAINGGQPQATNNVGEGEFQDVYVGKPGVHWTSGGWYMCEKCESRVKPKKEKRWVVLQYDSELGDWCIEDGTLYKTLDEAEDNRRYGQLSEIEVEV